MPRILDQERRQRVAGRGSRAEVAAERAAVADLRRADGASRGRECGQRRGDLAAAGLGVRERRSQHELVALVVPAAQLRHAPEVEQRIGPLALGVERDHEIGAAGDRARSGVRGAQAGALPRACAVRARPRLHTSGERQAGPHEAPPRLAHRAAVDRDRAAAQERARDAAAQRRGRRTGCADGGTRARRPSAPRSARDRAGADRRSSPARSRPPGRPRRSAGPTEQRNARSLLVETLREQHAGRRLAARDAAPGGECVAFLHARRRGRVVRGDVVDRPVAHGSPQPVRAPARCAAAVRTWPGRRCARRPRPSGRGSAGRSRRSRRLRPRGPRPRAPRRGRWRRGRCAGRSPPRRRARARSRSAATSAATGREAAKSAIDVRPAASARSPSSRTITAFSACTATGRPSSPPGTCPRTA